MKSLILRTAAGLAMYLLLTFSIFLLLRGHNAPGGGFIGGLVAAAAVLVQLLAFDLERVRRLFPVDYPRMVGVGLALATGIGIAPMFFGYPFLTSFFTYVAVPFIGDVELSTVLVFDIGVYMVVIGSVLTVVVSIAEERGPAVDVPPEARSPARHEGDS